MFPIVPLADDEPRRFNDKDFIGATLYIRSKECGKYNHIWYSEIGKLLYFSKRLENWEKNENLIFPTAFLQNRRFFKNLLKITLKSKDEVVLAPLEYLDGQSILTQFWYCHRESYEIYEKIITKNFKKDLYDAKYMSPHNIFVGDTEFVKEYSHWLKLNLDPYFDCYLKQKYGAWMCERFLHLFAHSYFKVRTEPIITLPKINM